MKVLVGITTRNRADILPKSIQSALDQDYPHKEVVVFDDASSDATPSVRSRFSTVSWHRAERNMGLVAARNKLMQDTAADFYFSLDDDAWFVRGDEISQGVALMQAQPVIAALAYDILSPDRPNPRHRSQPLKTNLFIGCGHLLRLSAVREVSYYALNPGNYGAEESDLCVRLLDRSHEIVFLPGVHVWHDKSSLARKPDEQYSSAVCNDLAFVIRRYPFPIVLAGLPAKLFSHFRFAVSNQFIRAYAIGVAKCMGALPTLWGAREPVSSSAMLEFRRRGRTPSFPVA